MKLLVKVAIAALIANAMFRVGTEYLTYIKFRDSIRDAAMFKAHTDAELEVEIMELANDYDVPVQRDALTIRREARHVFVDGSYRKEIEIAPRVVYAWPFSWSIDVMTPTTVPMVPPKPRVR
jgi:hypothetical protein